MNNNNERKGAMRALRSHAWKLGIVGLASGLSLALAACSSESQEGDLPTDPGETAVGNGGVPKGPSGPTGPNENLDNRKEDYPAAFRIAKLKLVDEAPTLAEIKQLEAAADKKATYEQMIDGLLADNKRFGYQMIKYWNDTFRTGARNNDGSLNLTPPQNMNPNMNSAALFAASVVVGDRPYTDLFTATAGTCPTYDVATGAFTPADCAGAQQTAGVLTDPGLMSAYFSAMAFRRARFVQETFVCSKFPAETTQKGTPMGAGVYTGVWDFKSISGKQTNPTAKVDFHDTSAVICANCHSSMNHITPLFANFAANGTYNAAQIQVQTPVPGNPRTELVDFLPAGETTAWRKDKPAADLRALGQAMAADNDVARCAVTRAWNYALSRGDVVESVSPVPLTISDPLLENFKKDFKVRPLLAAIFKSPDFVKF
jgi:hypothetical protein